MQQCAQLIDGFWFVHVDQFFILSRDMTDAQQDFLHIEQGVWAFTWICAPLAIAKEQDPLLDCNVYE